MNVVRLDAAAIENAEGAGMTGGKALRGALAEKLMGCRRDFRRCRTARTDSPNRLVCNQNTGELLRGQRAGASEKLRAQDVFGLIGFAVIEQFADAHYRSKTGIQGGNRFLGDGVVSIAKELPALGVADDDVAATGFGKHGRSDLAGEGTFLVPVHILAGNGDAVDMAVNGGATTMSQCFEAATSGRNEEKNARVSVSVLYIFQLPAIRRRRIEASKERKDNVETPRPDPVGAGTERGGYAEKGSGHLLVRASTPGSFRPPRNSREAPPPVEMWDI